MKLNIGEVICSKCNGLGNFGYTVEMQEIQMGGRTHRFPGLQTEKICPKCKGAGKLDWIEAVVGKKCRMMKPGVYTYKVDYSNMIPNDGNI